MDVSGGAEVPAVGPKDCIVSLLGVSLGCTLSILKAITSRRIRQATSVIIKSRVLFISRPFPVSKQTETDRNLHGTL